MDLAPDVTLVPLLLLAAAGFAWLAVNRFVFRDVLSPFALLFVAWIAPLVLQTTNLSSLETPWAFRSVALVAWVTVALAGTSLLVGWFFRGAEAKAGPRAHFADSVAALRRPAFLVPFFACYAIAFAAYLYAEFLTNPVGVPLLAVARGEALPVDAIHRWGKDTRWAALTALLFVLTPIAYFAAHANARRRTLRWILFALAVLYPLMGVLKLSRSDVFVGGINLVIAAVYTRRFGALQPGRRPILRYAVLGIGSLALYYAMMTLRIGGSQVEDLYADAIGFRASGAVRGPAAAVYGYTALPFENLHRFLELHDWTAVHPGVSVTRPFLSVTGQGDLADRLDADIRYPPPASFAAGSSTFLSAVYAEAGLVGAAMVPILYALLVNATYVRMRRRPTIVNLLLYANFVYPWLWLFFNNGFGVLGIYLNAAFILAIGRLTAEADGWRQARLAAAPA
jgi:hypothetical protein